MSELRWNPVLEQWVITATHRQDRTYKPPKDFCPLCPTKPGKVETEIPAQDFEIAVFENMFPSLQRCAPDPAVPGNSFYRVKKAAGICEVVVYTPSHSTTLAEQPVEKIFQLGCVWQDRFRELGDRDYIKYVFIFENKGEVIGVTLHHPHGQIYAFSYVPPVIQRELESTGRYWKKNRRCLFCDILRKEISERKRLVAQNSRFAAFIPFFARYPYEVHIFSRKHLESLDQFSREDIWQMAEILKTVLVKYDKLFGFSLPYMMVMHQSPTDGRKYPGCHWHIEFYPPYRTAEKLKYLAGCESGAGSFINDTLAEEKAEELRKL